MSEKRKNSDRLTDLARGLAISDFWMAINFLSSASINISGSNIGSPREKNFCSFNGFMIQVFVVQSQSLPPLPLPSQSITISQICILR